MIKNDYFSALPVLALCSTSSSMYSNVIHTFFLHYNSENKLVAVAIGVLSNTSLNLLEIDGISIHTPGLRYAEVRNDSTK